MMCSADESQQVIKFKDYILILPSIKNFAPELNSNVFLTNSPFSLRGLNKYLFFSGAIFFIEGKIKF